MRALYRRGADMHGWICTHCRTEFEHRGRPRRTFARLMWHKAIRHRGIPRETGRTTTRHTFTYEFRP